MDPDDIKEVLALLQSRAGEQWIYFPNPDTFLSERKIHLDRHQIEMIEEVE